MTYVHNLTDALGNLPTTLRSYAARGSVPAYRFKQGKPALDAGAGRNHGESLEPKSQIDIGEIGCW